MLNLWTKLTNWEAPCTTSKANRKDASEQESSFEISFNETYSPKFPRIENEEKLQKTMVMVGNLSDALEKRIVRKEDDATGSLSDDNSVVLGEEVEALQREKEYLTKHCKALEQTVEETRRESGVWKLKMTMAMGHMRTKVESLEEDRQCLSEKCKDLGFKLLTSKMENASKQSAINELEYSIQIKKGEEEANKGLGDASLPNSPRASVVPEKKPKNTKDDEQPQSQKAGPSSQSGQQAEC